MLSNTADAYEKAKMIEEDACEPDKEAVMELRQAQEAFDREMEVSQRVTASTLEKINVRTPEESRLISIAKELPTLGKAAMIELLREYKDVFSWSREHMTGLDRKFYQHQIHLSTDAKPVKQCRYRMNPKYVVRVK